MKRTITADQAARLRRALDSWFYDSPLLNRWVCLGPIQVYLRKNLVRIGGRLRTAITIANVSVNHNQHHQGWFRTVLEWAAEQPVEALKIENAITPRMVHICEEHGWVSDNGDPPSFHKELRR